MNVTDGRLVEFSLNIRVIGSTIFVHIHKLSWNRVMADHAHQTDHVSTNVRWCRPFQDAMEYT